MDQGVYVSEGQLDSLIARINQLAAYCKEKNFGEFTSRDDPGTLDIYLMARGIRPNRPERRDPR